MMRQLLSARKSSKIPVAAFLKVLKVTGLTNICDLGSAGFLELAAMNKSAAQMLKAERARVCCSWPHQQNTLLENGLMPVGKSVHRKLLQALR